MSGAPTFSYVPSPPERAYYGALFQAADVDRTGSIGGAQAVEFLSRSKVPVAILKQIWAVSDRPATNALDARKFAVAVRLIQLEQHGLKPTGPDLAHVATATEPLRPPFFEGMAVAASTNPPTPPRPPPTMGSASVAGSSVVSGAGQQHQQLAVQDPYGMTPSEQARYEQIFPEYCKQDPNFMHGPEAVALFNKSGLPNEALKHIWNMVDFPVDNRLDKLEFAIAMHLIVCVSKKNLPMPGGLPICLKQLKSQKPPTPLVSSGPPSVIEGPPSPPAAAAPQPQQQMQMQQLTQPVMGSGMDIQPPLPQASNLSGMPGPPPLAAGTTNISDAFEGLGPAGDTGSISSFRASTPVTERESAAQPTIRTVPEATEPETAAPQAAAPAAAPTTPSTLQLASSYDMGEAPEELEKLRGVLQKLQAENISLKAKMGSMTEEEKDVQKELNATVAEISSLSSDLTVLRAQVLAAKSRLLEATAELKAAKEKKGVVTDLIAEATATKAAIDEAYETVETANEVARAAPTMPTPAQEEDLFGAWGDDAPAPLPGTDSGSHYTAEESFSQPPPLPHQQKPSQLQPSQLQPSQQQFQYENPAPVAETPSYQQAAAPEKNMYNGGGYDPSHNRNASAVSFGEVMGTGPGLGLQGGLSDVASVDAISHSPSMKEVEDFQSKSKEADDVARDAEESRRQLVAQLEELRRVADEAESKSRAANAKPEKKKKLLGRGKKKDAKEAAKLTLDAREKKDALLHVQSQVKDAEALALATRKEAERLHKEAEDVQMQAAAAASMQQQQMVAAPSSNGYDGYPAQGPTYNYGMASQNKPLEQTYGYGAPPPGPPASGYDANVMSSSGNEIPVPSGANDPYSNPFE